MPLNLDVMGYTSPGRNALDSLRRNEQSNASQVLARLGGLSKQDGTLRLLHTTSDIKALKFKSAGGFKALMLNRDRLNTTAQVVTDLLREAGIVHVEPAPLAGCPCRNCTGLDRDDFQVGIGISGRGDPQQPIVRAHERMAAARAGAKSQHALTPALTVFERGRQHHQMIKARVHAAIMARAARIARPRARSALVSSRLAR